MHFHSFGSWIFGKFDFVALPFSLDLFVAGARPQATWSSWLFVTWLQLYANHLTVSRAWAVIERLLQDSNKFEQQVITIFPVPQLFDSKQA